MTKFIPISMIMLFALMATSCTRSLDVQEDFQEDINLTHQVTLKMQSRESDSTSSTNAELYPDPDVPIKDTHDWKIKP
ncbi:hypothetical protein [Chryseobacterium luquanense]|uniref:Lipoprotein n=1 Tax=Chryseobacterium luquanense TaxID=2983766 RepID=A0ABT3XY87_9FLAO|nr:hypothetical protein [Chryseobacterium luquanense]MCX8530850.1 hypothetical protein [Chryseobacterium luquanense]